MKVCYKILALSLTLFLLILSSVSAGGVTFYDNVGTSDTPGRSIVITGAAKPLSSVRIQVLKPNKTYNDVNNITSTNISEILEYIYEGTVNQDGSFETEPIILHSGTNEYKFRVIGTDISVGGGIANLYEGVIKYCTPNDITAILAELKLMNDNTANDTQLRGFLSNNKDNLMINTPLFQELSSNINANVISNIFEKKSNYTFGDIFVFRSNLYSELSVLGINSFDRAGIERLLDPTNTLYAAEFLGLTGSNATEAENYRFNKYLGFTEAVKGRIATAIKSGGNHTVETLKTKYSDTVFTNIVNDSENLANARLTWQGIGAEIDANHDLLPGHGAYNQLSDNQKAIVQQTLFSKKGNWSSASSFNSDLVKAVNDLKVATPKPPTSSHGGGGGGSGGPSVSGAFPIEDNVAQEKEDVFTDLDGVQWAQTAIRYLASNNIVAGSGDKMFLPNNTVTREEFIKMAVLAFDKFDTKANTEFEDVSAEDWFYPYIASAQNIGVVKGISQTHFGVGLEISRQDLVTIMYNFIYEMDSQIDKDIVYIPFSDQAHISDYAVDAVKYMAGSGVISGVGDNMFAPLRPCTRAEAAKIIFEVVIGINK